MKRLMNIALLSFAMLLCGCGRADTAGHEESVKIVATILPEYDWVKNILGENPAGAELTLLLDSGTDLHSYQPTAADIMKVADCDVFICVGGESDRWVDDALKESRNPEMTVIRLLEVNGSDALEEELPEGAQEEEEEEEDAYDEHIWLSLRRTEVLVREIGKAAAEKDPEHADVYEANTDAYIEELKKLDAEYESAVSAAEHSILVFGDRFPFRYLAEDYGLTCYAAFAGCSAETEASFETVLNLAGKLDEYGLIHVMKIEGSDERIARTIIDNSKDRNRDILTLNSMQGAESSGFSYLGVMKENLEVLKEALR